MNLIYTIHIGSLNLKTDLSATKSIILSWSALGSENTLSKKDN